MKLFVREETAKRLDLYDRRYYIVACAPGVSTKPHTQLQRINRIASVDGNLPIKCYREWYYCAPDRAQTIDELRVLYLHSTSWFSRKMRKFEITLVKRSIFIKCL